MRDRAAVGATAMIAVAGVVAFGTSACGGDGDSTTSETVTATTEASPTTGATTAGTFEDPGTIVLRLSDLPPGWMELDAGEGFGDDEVCGFRIADDLVATAETNFQDGAGTEGVGSESGVAAGPGDAESLFEVVESTLDACTEWETPGGAGAMTWQVEPADAEPLGDQSIAVQLQTGTGADDFRAVAVYVRVKEYISGVADTRSVPDAGTVEEQIADTERLARIVVDRMGEPAG